MATSSFSTSNEEWVPAQEAAMLLARSFGGQTVAKQAVALALREGILRARAEWSIWLEEGDEQPKELEATADHPIEIEAKTWCSSINWEADRLGWDWTEGCFDVEGHFAEDDKAYGGVSFLKADLLALEPDSSIFNSLVSVRPQARSAMEDVKARRSASPPKWEWEMALAELIAHADGDGLEDVLDVEFKRGFQARLENWFDDWFRRQFDGSPSEDQRRIRARMIVDAMRRVKDSKRAAQ